MKISEKFIKEHGFKTKEEALNFIKSHSPRFKEYWIAKGYSEEEAKFEIAKKNPGCIAYWTCKGYSEEEAKIEISRRNPCTKEYWIFRGYSEEKAKLKVAEKNPTHKEYWMTRGYSEEDASIEIRKRKNTCKEYWIAKGYSEEEAIELAKNFAKQKCPASKEYWIAKGYSEEEAIELAKHNGVHFEKAHAKFTKKQNRFCKEYWIAKGYSEEEAIELAKNANKETTRNIPHEKRSEAAKRGQAKIPKEIKDKRNKNHSIRMKLKNKTHSPIFKEYWIAKGYSEEEARYQVFITKFSSQKNFSQSSKIELKFFEDLKAYINIKENDLIQQKWVRLNEHNYCQDGRYNNTVIEFNGTNFHLDSRFYNENSKNPVGTLYKDVKEKDFNKINAYLNHKYNVIVVWEYDYLNHKNKLFEIIKDKLLNESNKEGNYWDSASFFNKC